MIENGAFLADELLTDFAEIGKHFGLVIGTVNGSMNGGFVVPKDIQVYDLVLFCYLVCN